MEESVGRCGFVIVIWTVKFSIRTFFRYLSTEYFFDKFILE